MFLKVKISIKSKKYNIIFDLCKNIKLKVSPRIRHFCQSLTLLVKVALEANNNIGNSSINRSIRVELGFENEQNNIPKHPKRIHNKTAK